MIEQFGHSPDNRQPEPETLLFAARSFYLMKLVKDVFELVRLDAYTCVDDIEVQASVMFPACQRYTA